MDFTALLSGKLRSSYTPPHVAGGHDFTHVEWMIRMGREKISTIMAFDMKEFEAAAWLHNLDRSSEFREVIGGDKGKLAKLCSDFLEDSPFGEEARKRIVTAVVEHNKKDDEAGDSTLLAALRIADKLVRLGPLGIVTAASHRGSKLLPYDSEHPFGYDSTAEDRLKTTYDDFFRVLEWIKMMPSDAARSLIDRKHLSHYLAFLRHLGEEIAENTRKDNRIEEDIKKALGPYYEEWCV